MSRWTILLVALGSFSAGSAPAQAPVEAEVRVRVEPRRDAAPSALRFLRENREFLRARLDQLRQSVHWNELEARPLSEHERWLKDLEGLRSAATDSLEDLSARSRRDDLLRRIEDLARIEAQLDRLDSLTRAQGERLRWISADYAGRQETALALLARGLPDPGARALIVEGLDGESVRVDLAPEVGRAMVAGGVAELLHDFVEPRPVALVLAWVDAAGERRVLGELRIEPVRDRLNFVAVDFGGATAERPWSEERWTR